MPTDDSKPLADHTPPVESRHDPRGEMTSQPPEPRPVTATFLPAGDGPTTDHTTAAPRPEDADAAPPLAARAIQGYELLGLLGRGGMGVVYKARDLALKRIVALKTISAGTHAAPHQLARFRVEAEAVARLQHPNIVQIHEVGDADGRPYCVLEFVEGGSLAARIAGNPMPPREAARLVEVVARAVQLAHSRNVVHRDLKPANVLLAADGTPKITDFGLARQLDADSGETRAGTVMGTPSYMAPEQASGRSHDAGPAADIYALGAILYECLSGRPPFKGGDIDETLHLVRTQEPVPPSRCRSVVPLDLETICLKCLRKEPENRYPSAAEMADDLQRYSRGEPILARPVGRREKLWRWVRRNPALAGVTMLMAAAVLAVAVVSAVLAVREHGHARDLAAALAASEGHRRVAAHRLAESYLDRGIALCEQGELARGLLWLARGLEVAPADARNLQDALRANIADWSRWLTPLRGVFRHAGPVALQVVGPDARTVLVVTADGRTELWDAVESSRRVVLQTGEGGTLAAFSSDGGIVVTARTGDGVCRLWNPATGDRTGAAVPAHGPVKGVAVSRAGTHVLTAGVDHKVRIWDGATGARLAEFRPHAGPLHGASFSPDGRAILTTSQTEAALWTASTGGPIGAALRHGDAIAATAFSGNGQLVITGGWDRTAQVWSVATGLPVGNRIKHPKPVGVVALSPDGGVAFVGGDANGQLWNVADGKPLGPPLAHRNDLSAAAFSGDGSIVVTGGLDACSRLWDAATGGRRGPELPQGHTLSRAGFGPSGGAIFTESRDGVVRLWETTDQAPALATLAVTDRLHSIRFDRDATLALTGSGHSGRGEARLWDVATGRPRGEILAHPAAVHALAISADRTRLLTGDDSGVVRCWSAATSQPMGPAIRHKDRVHCVAFGDDARTIWSGTGDDSLRSWDPATGNATGTPIKHDGQVLALALSPDGRLAVTGCSDSLGHLWSLPGRSPAASLRHQDWVIAVAVSPDGKTVLTGSDDTTARLWDAATGKPIGLPLVHQNAIPAVAFSPDGATVATGSEDRTARRWDLATGKPIGPPLVHPDWVLSVAIRADNRSLVTGCADKGLRVWRCPGAIEGSAERIQLWLQLLTGQELDDSGALRMLDAAEWHDRRARLRVVGGVAAP